jgi:hypothetical protein
MEAITVLTNRGLQRLLKEGGSQAWKLDPERARRTQFIVCVQNLGKEWGEPTHLQGQAFILGKISGVSPAHDRGDRYIIEFNEYAPIDIPDFWQGWRNPVRYIDLEEHGIDPRKLTFKTNTQHKTEPRKEAPAVRAELLGMNMADAKKALSIHYGVPVTAIEITIRG